MKEIKSVVVDDFEYREISKMKEVLHILDY